MRTLMLLTTLLAGCAPGAPAGDDPDGFLDETSSGESEGHEGDENDETPSGPVEGTVDIAACQLGTTAEAPRAPECGNPIKGCSDYQPGGSFNPSSSLHLEDVADIWSLLRDQASGVQLTFDSSGESIFQDRWYLIGDGAVLRQHYIYWEGCFGQGCDCGSDYDTVYRCCLRDADFFQGCIDAQEEAHEDCFEEDAWLAGCAIDAAQACPAG